MSEPTDGELVKQAQRGDRAAVGELFSRYWAAARAAAFGVTGEFASAEDAAAEAFGRALVTIDSIRDPDRFGAWLRSIVVRKARLMRRHPLAAIDADVPDCSESAEAAIARSQSEGLVRQAVRELPTALREAMALVYFEGYKPDVAARFLGIPDSTLRRRLHEGRSRVRANVQRTLEGSNRMAEERERTVAAVLALVEQGEMYGAMHGALELRPVPGELIDTVVRRGAPGELASEVAGRVLRVPERTFDPSHSVGVVGAAIRAALPEFTEWHLDGGLAAKRFFSTTEEYADRLQAVLPPGFAEGRPGAFLRATRAVVCGGESVFEQLRKSLDEATFRERVQEMRLNDAIDLTWMAEGPMELRSVQELLERLSSGVVPGVAAQFSSYDEPRYRSALQLRLGESTNRAAYGGVLQAWPGRPRGVEAAHLRILLESWVRD